MTITVLPTLGSLTVSIVEREIATTFYIIYATFPAGCLTHTLTLWLSQFVTFPTVFEQELFHSQHFLQTHTYAFFQADPREFETMERWQAVQCDLMRIQVQLPFPFSVSFRVSQLTGVQTGRTIENQDPITTTVMDAMQLKLLCNTSKWKR